MAKVKFAKPFRFSENGYSFTDYEAGQEYEVSDSCADSAKAEGAIDEPEAKAKGAAPENKAKVKRSKK